MTNFHIFSGTRLYQTHIFVKRMTCIFNLCAVQAESVQDRLSVLSTGRGCAVQMETLCSAYFSLNCTLSACIIMQFELSVKARLLKLHWPS